MSRVQPRTYEVAEANAALPDVSRLVQSVVDLGNQLPDLEDQLRIAQYQRSRGGPEEEYVARGEAMRAAEVELAGALTALEALGIQLKDMRLGLIAFLSYREGKRV